MSALLGPRFGLVDLLRPLPYLALTELRPMASRRLAQSRTVEDHMPTYEYRCRDCQNVFDRVERLTEHGEKLPACPKCKSKKVQQLLTPFFAKTSHKA
jgi:putative FmdB family regulatory protein